MTARREFKPAKNGKLRTSVVREGLVVLTGSNRLAQILNQFLYWSERVSDIDRYLREEWERSKQSGISFQPALTHGWIYKAARELKDEIMLDESEQIIRKDIKQLVEWGYLHERDNPAHKWDRTRQYRVDLLKIQEDLDELGYALDEYPLFRRNEQANQGNLQNGASINTYRASKQSNGGAIPETTIKTTTKKEYNLRANDARAEPPQAMLFDDSVASIAPKPPVTPPEKKPRQPDAYLDAIMLLWQVPAQRAATIKQQLQGRVPTSKAHHHTNLSPPVELEEAIEFATRYYPRACKGCSLPKSPEKLQDHIEAMRREKGQQAADIKAGGVNIPGIGHQPFSHPELNPDYYE